jgi:hypothetical protein
MPVDSKIRIEPHHKLRTLKRSARNRLEKERAPQLWILPWHESQNPSKTPGRKYPQATLLGLPTELRQTILFESYSVLELIEDAEPFNKGRAKKLKRLPTWFGPESANRRIRMDKAMRTKFGLNSYESELIAILSRKIGALCRVSPLVRSDMAYVSKRWREDLGEYLQRRLNVALDAPKTDRVPRGFEWLHAPLVTPAMRSDKKGKAVKAREKEAGRRVRPPKCWYCTERHVDGDAVCPMARRDPERWEEMTKKVGGWRSKKGRGRPTFQGRRVVFEG